VRVVSVLPDGAFGERVARRLRDETLVWLITVGADGTPQPNPVWFLWDGAERVLVYNRTGAHRLAHVAHRSQVALHFQASDAGGDVVVLTGTARVVDDVPAPDANQAYLDKYRAAMERVSGSVAEFAVAYPVPLMVDIGRVRGF
jgi:PPOX class probable F420-dependent enzyme